jgi:hypothetical protein
MHLRELGGLLVFCVLVGYVSHVTAFLLNKARLHSITFLHRDGMG